MFGILFIIDTVQAYLSYQITKGEYKMQKIIIAMTNLKEKKMSIRDFKNNLSES